MRCVAESSNSGALVLGVLGVLLGIFVGLRWAGVKKAFGGWKTARAGVPKAKAGRRQARGAFLIAARTAMLAAVLLIVYVIATSTALIKK